MNNDAYSNMGVDMHNLFGDLAADQEQEKRERHKNRRVILLKRCFDCPYFECDVKIIKANETTEDHKYHCHHMDDSLRNPNVIPQECPLPKAIDVLKP